MRNIKEILTKYNQEHLLLFFDELTDIEKQELINDIKKIDFEYMQNLNKTEEKIDCRDKIEPVKAIVKEKYSKEDMEELQLRGKSIIESGKYAIVTMAGGQGTRLGHNGPKGTLNLCLIDKDRYIFEIFIDYLKEAYEKYNIYLDWYIMTSKDNNKQTIKFFEENRYFGYPKEKIHFFIQGELPITDLNGNLLLETKSKVLQAADGNGGVFNAISLLIDKMKKDGIEWVLITGIDNILVNITDELYIGLVDKDGKLNGVKSIAKNSPTEKVGVFCKRNGKPSVIEYSEMSDDMRYDQDENGNLKYVEANIVNHLLNISVLEKIKNEKLPIHKAIKKINYIDKSGKNIIPNEPSLIKYEAFIFDYFSMVDDVTIYRVERENEFAPVKNKDGTDSPKTAIELYNNLYKKRNSARLNEIKELLISYNQTHLLNFYNEIDELSKQKLLSQIENIDFKLLERLYNNRNEIKNIEDKIEPISYIDKSKLSKKDVQKYTDIGNKSILKGELAFVTLAGGQGTRLGHNGPKGSFMLDLNPDKSLFEIMCHSLKNAHKEYNIYIPWYIMTSNENNDDTIAFFEKNNYFGYPKDSIKFFKQNETPMLHVDGKIILESKDRIKLASNGHGGVFEAMYNNNILQDMESKNIKWVFIGGIDNILLKPIDPLFMGITISKGTKISGKSIVKNSPEEKVGIFCKRNGRPSVVEYTEITDEMSHELDCNNELLYGESHILCNLFNLDALKQIGNEKLPYHIAFKKSSFVDSQGKEVISDFANAYKFETFMFDAFNKFEDMLIFRVLRNEEFAPIKNKEGQDSVETAKKLYINYWK